MDNDDSNDNVHFLDQFRTKACSPRSGATTPGVAELDDDAYERASFAYKEVDILNEPRLLTPAEAAALLDVTTRTLARWRADGTGPVCVPLSPAVIRYRASDLDLFIEGKLSRFSR